MFLNLIRSLWALFPVSLVSGWCKAGKVCHAGKQTVQIRMCLTFNWSKNCGCPQIHILFWFSTDNHQTTNIMFFSRLPLWKPYFVHEFSVQVSNQDNWSLRVWVRLFIQSLGFYFCNKVCVYLTQPFVGVIVILCLHLLDRSVQPEIYWYLQVLLFSGYIFFYFAFFLTRDPIWMASSFVCFEVNLSSTTHWFHTLLFDCGWMTSLIGYSAACLRMLKIALNNSTQRKKSKQKYPHGRDKDFPPAFSQETTSQNDLNRHA